jgi:hypothetical protein
MVSRSISVGKLEKIALDTADHKTAKRLDLSTLSRSGHVTRNIATFSYIPCYVGPGLRLARGSQQSWELRAQKINKILERRLS